MKKLILIIISSIIGINSYSQCNTKLMELAASQSGTDAIFIRDFKVKLDEGTMKRPSPVGRFQVYLSQNVHYRFNVANAVGYEGSVILQLYDRTRLMASTFDTESRFDHQTFDFICEKSGLYQVLMSFSEGKRGCAVGIMSMVLRDSMTVAEGLPGASREEPKSLYIGIDNELSIAATDIPGGSLEVFINQGSIEGANGRYIARVDKIGVATVKVIARDKHGNINEVDSLDFIVRNIPLPVATYGGIFEGIISRSDIDRMNEIKLDYPVEVDRAVFTIIEFTVSEETNLHKGEVSYSSRITPAQKNLINRLNSGVRFLIRDIYVRGPDGATHTLKPLTFIIE